MPYSFANTIDGSVDITYPDAKVRTIPVNTADLVKDPVNDKITISYVGEGAWSFAVGVADVSPLQASLDALHIYLAGFFFAEPGGGAVDLPEYENSLAVNAMYRGDFGAIPSPDNPIDGVVINPLVRFTILVQDTVDPTKSGIYFTISENDWTRDTEYDMGAELNELHVHVTDGEVFGGTDWYQSEATPLVGTDQITFIPAAVMVEGQVSPYFSTGVIVGDNSEVAWVCRHLHGTTTMIIDMPSSTTTEAAYAKKPVDADTIVIGTGDPLASGARLTFSIFSPIING